MITKAYICHTQNIDKAKALNLNCVSLDFRSKSPYYVRQISSQAGIIPNYGSVEAAQGKIKGYVANEANQSIVFCGVFADDMPQTIVTRIVNFGLNMVQLNGGESPVMINNLRNTVDPDIHPNIKIVKTLHIQTKTDIDAYKVFEGVADYILFDISAWENVDLQQFEDYKGTTPFLIGGINEANIAAVCAIKNPNFTGISINKAIDKDDDNTLETLLKVGQ